VAIGFAAALPKLGATGGWLRAEYSVKLPAIITIFIISGIGLKTKALLSALGDLRVHLLVQVRACVCVGGGGLWEWCVCMRVGLGADTLRPASVSVLTQQPPHPSKHTPHATHTTPTTPDDGLRA
jgi:hypothetical protein